jgi:hypothetical protein
MDTSAKTARQIPICPKWPEVTRIGSLRKEESGGSKNKMESAVIVAGHSISCDPIKKLAELMHRLYNGTLSMRACGGPESFLSIVGAH